MKRIALPAVALCALVLPAGASARVVELGGGAAPAAKSSCPDDPCEVFASSTGYMARNGARKNPFLVRRSGRVVAFTVTLSKLQDNQIEFFNQNFYGPPSVRISVLRKSKKRRTRLNHRLLRQSPRYGVLPYLGSAPTFALDRSLKVSPGDIVALTTDTWVPAFVSGLPRSNWWRSSRATGRCSAEHSAQRAAQDSPRSIRRYGCRYFRARLMYTVTYVPAPRRTDR